MGSAKIKGFDFMYPTRTTPGRRTVFPFDRAHVLEAGIYLIFDKSEIQRYTPSTEHLKKHNFP
jgi:hypothetical protein